MSESNQSEKDIETQIIHFVVFNKQEGQIFARVVNKSKTELCLISFDKVKINGTRLDFESQILEKLKPGERSIIDTFVSVPQGVPFEFSDDDSVPVKLEAEFEYRPTLAVID